MGRLTVNTIFLTLEKSAHLMGAMVVMVAAARLLGEGTLAAYVFVIGLTAFFVPILDAGFNNRVIKSVSSRADLGRAAVAEALAFKATLAAPTLLLMGAAAWSSGQSADVLTAVLLVGVSTVGMSVGDAFNSALKGVQRPAYSALLIGGLNLLLVASCLTAMLMGMGLVAVAVCFAVCRVGYALAGAVAMHRVVPWACPVSLSRVGGGDVLDGLKHLAAVYFLGNLLHVNYITTYVSADEGQSADFAIGYRVAAALLVLCTAGLEAVLPHVAQRFQSCGYTRRALGRTFAMYGCIGLTVALVTQLAAGPAVRLVFGEGYAGAVAPVRVLAWSVPVFVICGLGHTVLMGMDRQGWATAVLLGLLVFGSVAGVAAAVWGGAWVTAAAPCVTGAVFAAILAWMAWRSADPAGMDPDGTGQRAPGG